MPASFFSYDAAEEIIHYHPKKVEARDGKIALLHEISHAKLGHFHYVFDIELLLMEVAAWQYTKKLAKKHNVVVSETYVQDCIASYDDWVTKRGTCPSCANFCLQEDEDLFGCFVCNTRWQIASSLHQEIVQKVIT